MYIWPGDFKKQNGILQPVSVNIGQPRLAGGAGGPHEIPMKITFSSLFLQSLNSNLDRLQKFCSFNEVGP